MACVYSPTSRVTRVVPEPASRGPRAAEPAGEALEDLVTFIAQTFDQRDELKSFVRQLPEGAHVATTLPGDIASAANLAYALIAAVMSRGLLDADFFALLLKMRPKLGGQINTLRQRCLCVDEPAGTIAPGVILRGGRYKLEELIDHGGVASVWRAADRQGGTQVAIKVLRRDMRDYKLRRWQFIKGAKHFAAISHPRVARIIEPHFMEMGLDFCVLQYIRGISLTEIVKSRRLATPLAVVDVILEIGTGLAALHPRIFHGDISPKNIIISDDGHATLVDFDLASDIDELPMTQATGLPGTDPYASPEWRNRHAAIDARTDIFSLGMTAVYALYGGKNLPLGLNDSLVGEPGPFIDKYLSCDVTIKTVLKRACAFELSERYETVQQFCRELAQATRPQVPEVPAAAPLRTAQKPKPAVSQPRPVAEELGRAASPTPAKAAMKAPSIVAASRSTPDHHAHTNPRPTPSEQPRAPVRGSASTPQVTSAPARSPPLEPRRGTPEPPTLAVTIVPGATAAARRSSPTNVPIGQNEASLTVPAMPGARRRWPVAMLAGLFVIASGFTSWILLTPVIPESVDPGPVVPPAAPNEGLSKQELELARAAIQNLGLRESDAARAALQRIVNDPNRPPRAVAEARLLQAELLLMRALGCQIAIRIEPNALDGQLRVRAAKDPQAAEDLLRDIGEAVDPGQLRRVRALQALVQGRLPGDLPPASEELQLLVTSEPMWRGTVEKPPEALVTALQRIPDPSSLGQSVLALALWNSGDRDGARDLLRKITDRITDHPAADVLLASMSPDEHLAEINSPEPPEQRPEPATVTDPSKKAPRKTSKNISPPAATSEADQLFTIGVAMRIVRDNTPAMVTRCKTDHYQDLAEHASGNSVTLTISIRDDGQGLEAVPDGASEDLLEAKCLVSAIKKIEFGPYPATRKTFPAKFSL